MQCDEKKIIICPFSRRSSGCLAQSSSVPVRRKPRVKLATGSRSLAECFLRLALIWPVAGNWAAAAEKTGGIHSEWQRF
jgi:hypothetical protein